MPNISWSKEELEDRKESSSGINTGIDSGSSISQGYNHGSLTRGLVAYYPMEKGQGNVLLDGALGNHGQINGASWNGSGQVGSDCLSFDGSDYTDITAIPKVSNRYTISLWVNQTASTVGDGTKSRAFELNYNTALHLEEESGDFQIDHYDGTHNEIFASHSGDTWNHYLVTYDGSQVNLYKNNTHVGSTSAGESSGGGGNDRIGSDRDGNRLWNGKIDDVRIYNRALSKPEIKALYNLSQPSGHQITDTDVPNTNQGGISRYKFNENVKDAWGDSNGTGHTSEGYISGVYSEAKSFNSSNNDYIDLNGNFGLGSDDSFSWSVWSKPGLVSNNRSIMGRYNDSDDNIWFGFKDSKYHMVMGQAGGSVLRVKTGSPPTDKWKHILASYDASTPELKYYVNGNLIGTDSGSLDNFADTTNIYIGSRGESGGLYYDGVLDDLRVYKTDLTPQQVEQLYKLGAHKINRGDTLQ